VSAKAVLAEQSTEADKTDLTPLIDIAFLIIIFFMCLPFKTLDGKLQAFLPTDKGLAPTPEAPPELFFIKVHIVGRKEEPRDWGPEGKAITVKMPTEVKYRFPDGTTTGELDDVARYIAKMQRAAKNSDNSEVRGEIKAQHKVPHKFIIAVLNKFAEANLEKVDFYGTEIPKKALLDALVLPYPAKRSIAEE
jgi:biopolymer transport protein ExbD